MTVKALKVVINVLFLAGCISALATAIGVWEGLQGASPWGAVGLVLLWTVGLFGIGSMLERVGRQLSGGRIDWWKD